MNRRTFFATTLGALTASVMPVKAEVDTTNMFLPYPYYEFWKNSRKRKKVYEIGDHRIHRCAWEYWDGVTWVPRGEVRCKGEGRFCHPRHHCHPSGDEYSTRPLPDDRYPTPIWTKDGVQKNPEWETLYGIQKDT